MADTNIIRFGLSKAYYATYTKNTENGVTTYTFATPVAIPNAVSLTLTREGGDSSDFYADNGVRYTFSGTNGGYSADWEFARVPDSARVALLGEEVDHNGVQYEFGDKQPNDVAMICQVEGDVQPTAFVFFGCKASRIEMTANTKNESPEVNTETIQTRISGMVLPVWDSTAHAVVYRNVIQGHKDVTAAETAFFATVQVPSSAAA